MQIVLKVTIEGNDPPALDSLLPPGNFVECFAINFPALLNTNVLPLNN